MSRKIGKLAKRYSRALLGAISAQGQGGATVKDVAVSLEGFSRVWREDPSLSSFVLNPMFDADARLRALVQVSEVAGLSQVATNFLRVLFKRDRISALPEISTAFTQLADEVSGVVQVDVTTAREINDEEKGEIEFKISSKMEGQPTFSWSVDAELLGGLVVKFGGRVIDGSLSGQLGRLERTLASQYSVETS